MEEKKWPRTWYRFDYYSEKIDEMEFIGESRTKLYFCSPFRTSKKPRFKKKEGGSIPWSFPWRETREEAEEDGRKYLEEKERNRRDQACRDAAPEMLEALIDIVSSIRAIDSNHPDLELTGYLSREIGFCDSVIKKAMGME